MKVRPSVKRMVGGLTVGVIGAYRLNAALRNQRSYASLLEAFTYKLGQVSGISYGRMAVAADERTSARHAVGLTHFEHEFSINIGIGDATVRWINASFTADDCVGRVRATLAGDPDTLARLAKWLRTTVFTITSSVQLNNDQTELTFQMEDTNFSDVRETITLVEARGATTGDLPQC